MRTRLFALAMFAAIGLAHPALAQKPDAQSTEVARQLLQVMGADAQFDTVIKTMLGGMADQLRRQHPTHAATITDVFGRMAERFLARKTEALDMVAPLWAEKFSIAELNEIARFYKSPIGAKLIAAQPEIMQRSMTMGMAWGQRIGQEVEREAREELKKRGIPI